MSEKENQKALVVYQTICSALEARKWKYDKDESKLMVYFGVNGDSLPIKFIILTDANRQMIRVMVPLQQKFCEEKRVEGAIATCAANYGMVDGGFDYDLSDGQVIFRATASFQESIIGEGLIDYLIDLSGAMVDKYSADFFALDKGYLNLEDFMKKASE